MATLDYWNNTTMVITIVATVAVIVSGLWGVGRFLIKKGSHEAEASYRIGLIEGRVTAIESLLTAAKIEDAKVLLVINTSILQIKEDIAFLTGRQTRRNSSPYTDKSHK